MDASPPDLLPDTHRRGPSSDASTSVVKYVLICGQEPVRWHIGGRFVANQHACRLSCQHRAVAGTQQRDPCGLAFSLPVQGHRRRNAE